MSSWGKSFEIGQTIASFSDFQASLLENRVSTRAFSVPAFHFKKGEPCLVQNFSSFSAHVSGGIRRASSEEMQRYRADTESEQELLNLPVSQHHITCTNS